MRKGLCQPRLRISLPQPSPARGEGVRSPFEQGRYCYFNGIGLRPGFARGSMPSGVEPIANSGSEVVKAKGNWLWAQREASAKLFRANILIAKELWPGCGLINISAPHRSRVKGRERPHQPASLARYTKRYAGALQPARQLTPWSPREGRAPGRNGMSGLWRRGL